MTAVPRRLAQAACIAGIVLANTTPAGASEATDTALKQAMRDELDRSIESLSMEDMGKPYFLAYRVDEVEGFRVAGRFGALDASTPTKRRSLSVELRVGSPAFDNTNFLGSFQPLGGTTTLTLDDDYGELRRQLWLATDQAYKNAQRALAGKRAALQNRNRDPVPDFRGAKPVRTTDAAAPADWSIEEAESLVRDLSATFREFPGIQYSGVSAQLENRRTYYLNSEGSTYLKVTPQVNVRAWARTQAADGTILEDSDVFYARSEPLPAQDALVAQVRRMAGTLSARREAEPLDRYSGPVLFQGEAAASLFATVFASRLAAVRVPDTESSRFRATAASARNPFTDKVGARVLPRFLNVSDQPTLTEIGGRILHGGFGVDDEGVPASPSVLVDRGRLRALLTTRNPVAGMPSQGGNRRGIAPVPSNLIVATEAGLDEDALHSEFATLIRERGNDYGIVVRRLRGSSVVRAAKVYPDGRQAPIRNAELADMSASTFKEIVAVSEDSSVHTLGFPATSILWRTSALLGSPRYDTIGSIVVPDLLFEEVTLRKPLRDMPRPPVMAHPYFDR